LIKLPKVTQKELEDALAEAKVEEFTLQKFMGTTQEHANLAFTNLAAYKTAAKVLDSGKIKDTAFVRDVTATKSYSEETSVFVCHLPPFVESE